MMIKIKDFFNIISNEPKITFIDEIRTTIKNIKTVMKKDESKQ